MKTISQLTIRLAVAALLSSTVFKPAHAQSDIDAPAFRPRTDSNAKQDLRLLRETLNLATDSNGDINPLGKYLQRSAESLAERSEQEKPSRIELRPKTKKTDAEDTGGIADREPDTEADKKPKLDSKKKTQVESSGPSANENTTIETLPGPRYTIIQQVSPQFARTIVDDFRPAQEYPVLFASAINPLRIPANNYFANFQEIPGSGAPNFSGGGQGIFPNGMPGGVAGGVTGGAPMGIDPGANLAPALPNNYNPSAGSGGNFLPGNPNPPAVINNAPQYGLPLVTPQPVYPGGALVSPSDSLPRYSPQPTPANGLPFVTNGPCPRDARFMVSRDAYRQDPCAPTRCGPTGYAPYSGNPGGSAFTYAPPTYMNNNRYDSGYRPLIGFGQTLDNASLGRGIIGQPVAYVDGQPLRNFIRYLFP